MTKKEARRLARMNASALIESMPLDRLYGDVPRGDDADEQRLSDAQQWIADLIRGKGK